MIKSLLAGYSEFVILKDGLSGDVLWVIRYLNYGERWKKLIKEINCVWGEVEVLLYKCKIMYVGGIV